MDLNRLTLLPFCSPKDLKQITNSLPFAQRKIANQIVPVAAGENIMGLLKKVVAVKAVKGHADAKEEKKEEAKKEEKK
jgi:hypothetical protein